MALESVDIQSKLQETFGDHVKYFRTEYDMFVLEADVDVVYNVIKFLKEEPSLNFNFLTDLCGVHYPDSDINEQFCVVYHLHNWYENKRIRVKTFLSGSNPNLVRILNMDEMTSFPMRKEFPMEDSGRTDKDDRFFGRTINNLSI